MTPRACRRRLIGLILATLVSTAGCSPAALSWLMMMGQDSKVDPQCKLASDDKKKEVKVVVLAYNGALETRQELIGADRELCSMLAARMNELFKTNQEKVTIVSTSRVQRYKDEHPNWQELGPEAVGKYFHADYVINLELNKLTLYQALSRNQMLRGNAEISVTVHDLSKPGEEPMFRDEYAKEYPPNREIPISDCSPMKFRQMFLTRVASDLSWYFTAHPVADRFPCD